MRLAALLLLAFGCKLPRPQVGVVAAFVATGEQDVGDVLARLRPLDDRPGAAKLRVVRVGGDHHHAIARFFTAFRHTAVSPMLGSGCDRG